MFYLTMRTQLLRTMSGYSVMCGREYLISVYCACLFQPSRGEYGLMVKYYARRGDMHRARETFESMRARGIEPTSHVYTR